MPRNIEIKARVADLQSLRAKAAALAAKPGELLEQTDTFFVVPHGRLKVRQFTDGTGELIAYDRPDCPGPKESVYARFVCPNARELVETLAKVLPVRGAVVKRRELFLVGQTRIHLDEVRGLGNFLELEVVLGEADTPEAGEQIAHELLGALGIPQAALISTAYIDLLERAPSS